jgi:O-antigen/teichoic acid export membrane protein
MKYNLIWNAFGNIIYLGCQWLMTVIVTRIAGYEDAGVLSLAMSISATFQTVALFGIRNYQVSDVNKKFSDSDYVSFRIFTCLAALLLCMIFSVINRYSFTQLTAIALFMTYRLSESFADVLHGIAQNNDHLDIAGKAFAMKGAATIVMFLAGYYLLGSLNGGLLLLAAGSWAITIFYDMRLVKKLSDFRVYFSPSKLSGLAINTVVLCIYMFAASAIATIPKFVLEKECDSEVLGIYSSIFAPALLIQAAAGYIFNPFAGKFAEYNQKKYYKGFFWLAFKLCITVLSISAVIFLIAAVYGEFGLVLLFGPTIADYSYLLIPILICTFATAFFAFFCMLEIVIRDFVGLISGCALGMTVTAVLSPILINKAGINGTSYALIAGTIAACICLLVFILIKIRSASKLCKEELL